MPRPVFPASEIQALKDSDDQQAVVDVNFMGLFGPQGDAAAPITPNLIAERALGCATPRSAI